MSLRIYKFTIPAMSYRVLPDDPNVAFSGCAAVAVASSAMAAQAEIERFAKVNEIDVRWLPVADVADFDVDAPSVVTIVMV